MATQEQKARLAALLIEFCTANELSGAKLAKLIQVAPPTAHAYLDGVMYPGEENRKRIAKSLNMTYEELQARINNEAPDRKLTVEELAREIRLTPQAEFKRVILPVVFDRVLTENQSSLNRPIQ